VTITHPEKVLFPEDGITKGELASYYESIAALILPHISKRPVTMERYPGGIGRKGFWQKDVKRGFPEWLERVEVPKKDGTVRHALINDTRSLMWMANQNTITPHVWVARTPKLYWPDVCVFDLDPSEKAGAGGARPERLGVPPSQASASLAVAESGGRGPQAVSNDDEPELRAAALMLRDLLTELGLSSWVKTTGSKGFHILLSLDTSCRTDHVAHFAHRVGTLLVERHPRTFTQEFSKADRGGRILVDTGRNGYSATFAAAYGVRAKPGAPVSAPCTWAEIENGTVAPRTFTLRTMAERLSKVGDLWSDMSRHRISLEATIKNL
jgi:bifunctional non-homologous end joining protein LigD